MNRLACAFRVFFRTLSDRATAEKVSQWLAGKDLASGTAVPSESPPPRPAVAPPSTTQSAPPTQNPAITLLAALQREARLIDFLKEDLSQHADEQIGAAVREIHRDAAKLIERYFGLQPVLSESEGATVQLPEARDADRIRLSGRVAGQDPAAGVLRHHGWMASRCELPTFTGTKSAALILAPAEVEIV